MKTRRSMVLVSVAVAAALAVTAGSGRAAPLADVRSSGSLTVCAHPDALPFSAQAQAQPGFQLEIAEAVTKRLGVKLQVNWIVFTRHARRASCDAVMGAIVQSGAPEAKGPPSRLTRPYMGGGYVLVVPARRTDVRKLEDVKDGKIGVEHTSWPHYVLTKRTIPTSSFGSQLDILEAVADQTVAAGFASGPYIGWYLKQHPGSVRVVDTDVPDPEFRWNVAVRLLAADQALVDAVNQLIDALVADHTIEQILARYGITYVPPAAP